MQSIIMFGSNNKNSNNEKVKTKLIKKAIINEAPSIITNH